MREQEQEQEREQRRSFIHESSEKIPIREDRDIYEGRKHKRDMKGIRKGYAYL